MPVLVREDVRLGERAALGAELRLQLVEEAEVDVDVAVGRAVERPDGGRRDAAAGRDLPVEEPRPRGLVVAQRLRPVRLDAVDDGDDAAVLALVRVLARAALLRELGVRRSRADRLAGERAELAEAPALARDHEVEDEHDDPDDAASAAEHFPPPRPPSPPPWPR